jgi:hypothetical protein
MSETSDHSRISEILDAIADTKAKTVSVQDVLEAFGDRAFGALMFVFAAPAALPMPPGFSALLGAPLLFITAQLMVGRRTLWLPKALTERTIKRSDFAVLIQKLTPALTWLERFMEPRLSFLYNPWLDRLTGLVCLMLTIIVIMPIPFTHMAPSLALAAFGLGLAERDGVLGFVGVILTGLGLLVIALLSKAIIAGVTAFVLTLLHLF